MGLDEAVEELYALPPETFVANRTARAKELAAAGDKDGATAVRRLSKPSVSAWLVNSLVRQHRTDVKALLDLKKEFRGAQGSGARDRLRGLSAKRQTLMGTLVRQAEAIGSRSGHQMTAAIQREVEGTLEAAVADEGVAAEVWGGRLTKARSHIGFGGLDLGTSETPARRSASRGRSPTRGGRGERVTARNDEKTTKLRRALTAAESDLAQARRRHRGAEERRRGAVKALTEAERETARAAVAVARAESIERKAREGVRGEERP